MNMSQWISEIIEDKQRRLAAGVQQQGHLHVFEGRKIADGLIVGDTLVAKIRRAFRPKSSAFQLRLVNSDKASP